MHKRLKNAGLVTHSLTLPGHGTKPEDLVGVTAEDWIDAVVTKYREIRDAHPTLHLMLVFGAAAVGATAVMFGAGSRHAAVDDEADGGMSGCQHEKGLDDVASRFVG